MCIRDSLVTTNLKKDEITALVSHALTYLSYDVEQYYVCLLYTSAVVNLFNICRLAVYSCGKTIAVRNAEKQ